MIFNNKKASTMLLTFTIGLLLSLIIGATIFSGVSKYFQGQRDDNSYRLDVFKEKIEEAKANEKETITFPVTEMEYTFRKGVSYTIQIEPYEMFLFYSKPSGDITLHSNVTDKVLTIARPDDPACNNTACMCYVNNGPFWQDSPTKGGSLQPLIVFGEISYEPKVKKCVSADKNTIFFNSRGWDDMYADSVYNLLTEHYDSYSQGTHLGYSFNQIIYQNERDKWLKKAKEDVSGWKKVKSAWNHFAASFANTDENHAKSMEASLKHFINSYRWQGGVALGGTGFPKDPFAENPKADDFLGTVMPIQIEASVDNTALIGICQAEHCIYSDGEKHFEEVQRTTQQQIKHQDAMNNYKSYLENDFLECLKSNPSSCYDSFIHETEEFLSKDLDRKIQFSKLSQTSPPINITVYTGNTKEFSVSLSIPMPSKILTEDDGAVKKTTTPDQLFIEYDIARNMFVAPKTIDDDLTQFEAQVKTDTSSVKLEFKQDYFCNHITSCKDYEAHDSYTCHKDICDIGCETKSQSAYEFDCVST
ncbi:MAG: hypothetical protein ACQESC_01810, partial [Nanobdellota archaeon]